MKNQNKGQMIIEYVVMFMAIVAAIIFAATTFIKPAVSNFLNSSAGVIQKAGENISGTF